MTLFDRVLNQDSGFQIALSAIGAQHEKPKVNRWIPPSLLDNTPVMPCLLYVEAFGDVFLPRCWQSLGLCRLLKHRGGSKSGAAYLDREEIELIKQLGFKFEVIQKRIEL